MKRAECGSFSQASINLTESGTIGGGGGGDPAREGPFVLGVPIPIHALKAGEEDWVVMVLVECVCWGGWDGDPAALFMVGVRDIWTC